MPVATANGTHVAPGKNIWVAAGDGDLERVKELVETKSVSPNAPDPFTYTPMHAAASYGQVDILEYLISHGGDVNVTDEDGDTPIYTVENVDTAQWLVEHGANVHRINAEGVSPIDHLGEDFPTVASYLASLPTPSPSTTSAPLRALPASQPEQPSQHSQEVASEELTSALMERVAEIMARAEREGRDPDEELRAVVGRSVLEGMVTGYEMSVDGEVEEREDRGDTTKRRRGNEGPEAGR